MFDRVRKVICIWEVGELSLKDIVGKIFWDDGIVIVKLLRNIFGWFIE